MKKITFILLTAVWLSGCGGQSSPTSSTPPDLDLANKQGDLGNGFYLNPILGGDYPDPTIMRDGDDYYMTHSNFDYVPGLVVFHSKVMGNCHPSCFALIFFLGTFWALVITQFCFTYCNSITASVRLSS